METLWENCGKIANQIWINGNRAWRTENAGTDPEPGSISLHLQLKKGDYVLLSWIKGKGGEEKNLVIKNQNLKISQKNHL